MKIIIMKKGKFLESSCIPVLVISLKVSDFIGVYPIYWLYRGNWIFNQLKLSAYVDILYLAMNSVINGYKAKTPESSHKFQLLVSGCIIDGINEGRRVFGKLFVSYEKEISYLSKKTLNSIIFIEKQYG